MAFDEVSFPLKARYGAEGGPAFSTEVVTIEGGYERRNQNWSQARRRFDARTGVRSATDAALLVAFFQARAGKARGFRLKDWNDYTSAANGTTAPTALDQPLGLGDAATTQFQLRKIYGAGTVTHARTIRKPVAGTVLVALDGTPQASGWSVDATTGIVTFASPPAESSVITAGFQFDVPARFDTDQLSLTSEEGRLTKDPIPLIELRLA